MSERDHKFNAWKSDLLYLCRNIKTLGSSITTNWVGLQYSAAHSATDVSPLYRAVPTHAVCLIRLPKGYFANVTAEHMAEEAHDVQFEVKMKLDLTNAKYKVISDKYSPSNVFSLVDSMMVFLCNDIFLASAYNKLKPRKYGPFKFLWKMVTAHMWFTCRGPEDLKDI